MQVCVLADHQVETVHRFMVTTLKGEEGERQAGREGGRCVFTSLIPFETAFIKVMCSRIEVEVMKTSAAAGAEIFADEGGGN